MILKWNAFDLIKNISNWEIQTIITSPPYNIWKAYEKKTLLEDYLIPYKDFAKELYRTINDWGSLFWEVWNYIENWEIYPLDIFFYKIFKDAGFKLRNRIIWHFEHGLHASKRLSGRYETILWFTKSESYVFNLDEIRIPSKYPWKLHFKWPNKWKPSWNPLWKNPSDLWKIINEDWQKEIWSIPNVKANHPEKTEHPCQFPIELVERCILATSNQWDKILDPFLWAGSTILASMIHDRIWIWFEMDENYIKSANQRINNLKEGTLKIRPIWKPVHKPTWREKIAINPFQ